MTHLLVTNDFPPKVGGIQSYLWELWRRLPPGEAVVLTTPYEGADTFDAEQALRVERVEGRVLLPTPALRRRIEGLIEEVGADLVVFDPVVPLGLLGPRLPVPYAIAAHGAELVVPGRLPGAARLVRHVLGGASLVVTSGEYPADQARALAPHGPLVVSIPPGVDAERFRPLDEAQQRAARRRFGLPGTGRVVLGVSRLVPRKGFDVLIEAVARLTPGRPDLVLALAGAGRDRARLERLAARHRLAVRFFGRVADADLPAVYGAADVFAMLARSRWCGLEQEGFGIVFLEAASAGVPQVGGDSGGVAEAVAHGETGFVVAEPEDPAEVAEALAALLDDRARRVEFAAASRRRVLERFTHDHLGARLGSLLASLT